MTFKLPKKEGFAHKVYAELLKVPKGKVTTYKALAQAVGTKAYRAIGQVMNKNPYAPDVPCHRVISSDRTLSGFASGSANKLKLLRLEGIELIDEKTRNNKSTNSQKQSKNNLRVEEKYIIRKL